MRETEERRGMWVYVGARVRGGLDPHAPAGGSRVAECARASADLARDFHAPRVRSGLAYAAGFAGLAVLFRPSVSTLLLWHLGMQSTAGITLFFLTGLVAPLALALGFAAGAALDRERGEAGRLQALFGFLVGLWGTFGWAAEFDALARYLGYF